MQGFIFGERSGIHIIDLSQSVPLLHQALVKVRETAAKGGRVLFVGTKRQAADAIAEAAGRCAQYFMNDRWLGGTLTNWATVSNSIKRLRDLDDMQGMLDGSLDFLSGKLVEEQAQPLDIVALLESMADDAQDTGQAVTLQVPSGPLRLNARPRALRRAVTNLIDNALKYGTRAHIEVAAHGHELHIAVDDDGPGLEPQELERVFEPFYRVENSRSRDTGGVGLGLAIVRQVARSHGGEVELLNRPEGGLRALMRLPMPG
jgi:signal transduction histidine kinase